MPRYALIAEFDPQRTAIYSQCVRRHGLQPVVVRDGTAACDVLRAIGAPTLLICDLSLPKADGFSVIADLRRISPPSRSAIVVFSAHSALRAAALNLREALGIEEVGDKSQPPESIDAAVTRALDTLAPARYRPTDQRDDLLQKIMSRMARSFGCPIVVIAIDLRDRRKIVAHMSLDEPSGTSYFWPVLEQVGSTGEPLVVPDLTKQSSLGVGLQAPALAVRAFAAIPLRTSNNRRVGALSLFDLKPQALTAAKLDLLLGAGRRIADELMKYYEDELSHEDGRMIRRSPEEWAALERLALTDRVTGLFNRHAGELAIDRELARARRTKAPLSVVLIDIDQFKKVNDEFGHSAGDRVLKEVSKIITSTFRGSDLAVRWGGDEFLILLPDVPISGAVVFAERARAEVEKLTIRDVGATTFSAGIVQVLDGEDARAVISRADTQLYEAKRSGRNLVKLAVDDELAKS